MSTEEYIERLNNDVFHEKKSKNTYKRLELLYKSLFDRVDDSELETIYNEVLICEEEIKKHMGEEMPDFDNPTPRMIFGEYSGLAYTAAILHIETKKVFLFASYQNDILIEMVKSPIFTKVYRNDVVLRIIISETLLDYNYAAGRSNTISTRIYRYMK